MNARTRIARLACAVLLAAVPLLAQADGAVRFGIGIGIPAPWYYAPPVYYPYPYYPYPDYPPAVVVPAPSTYVERAPSGVYSTHPVQAVYYYCAASKAYYPYVRECAGGWEQVPAQPR